MCQVPSKVDVTVLLRATSVPICLVILKGQKMPGSQAFFQPLPRFWELNLTVCSMPLLKLNNR